MNMKKTITKLKKRIRRGNLSYETKQHFLAHLITLKSKI